MSAKRKQDHQEIFDFQPERPVDDVSFHLYVDGQKVTDDEWKAMMTYLRLMRKHYGTTPEYR